MATNTRLTKLLKGREVDSVRQRGEEMDIDFTDGSTLSLKLAAANGSVTLADEDGDKEYPE